MGNTCCGGGPPEDEEFSDIRRAEQQPLSTPAPAPAAAQIPTPAPAPEEQQDQGHEAEEGHPPPGFEKKKIVRREKTAARMHHSTAGQKTADEKLDFSDSDPSKWAFTEQHFSGSYSYSEIGKKEEIEGVITEGLEKFKATPGEYLAIMYQTSMADWPEDQQKYTLVYRQGTRNFKPTGCSDDGWMTVIVAKYQRLPPLDDLGADNTDEYTDDMEFQGYKLHNQDNHALCPGRGVGVGDLPTLKIIGDVDPCDISQGSVGDCWLLSGISSLAEFDGAVKRLFRKTPELDCRPLDGPNTYTITLWDLATWTEVDVVIDERLAAKADGSGLLGCSPSEDGELWVPYLEKALAVHCGGWDKIDGGQCTHAWSLLTGCKEQYTIRRSKETGNFRCYGKYNPNDDCWEEHANSPHDGFRGLWPMAWPEVGGGGDLDLELNEEELFERLCAWDDQNYIIGAGTRAGSDTNSTDGIVDGHAYSVLECVNDVGGTDIDLIKVRNPWGSGEFETGEWDDDGPGWDEHPEFKEILGFEAKDDGIFWVNKAEFFKYYGTIYLSASDMTEFLED